ncbi:MAG: hypothetical protein Q8R40_07120 [bacterium]|nr:hypothetical protein [bacterium]
MKTDKTTEAIPKQIQNNPSSKLKRVKLSKLLISSAIHIEFFDKINVVRFKRLCIVWGSFYQCGFSARQSLSQNAKVSYGGKCLERFYTWLYCIIALRKIKDGYFYEDTTGLAQWYLLPSHRLGRAQLRWENFIHGLSTRVLSFEVINTANDYDYCMVIYGVYLQNRSLNFFVCLEKYAHLGGAFGLIMPFEVNERKY